MTLRALLTCALLALPAFAHAAQTSHATHTFQPRAQVFGPLSNCSGTVGGSAVAIVFTPSVGTAPTAPQDYLFIQNNSTSSQNIWINILPGGTATAAPPSIEILPTASITLSSSSAPVPLAVSIIASAASAAYTCNYK